MKSLDTNILLYAINRDCAEYQVCREVVDQALAEPDSWIVADQVWFELYRLLRNPAILQKPLTSEQAVACSQWYRESSGWLQCAWEPALMKELYPFWKNSAFPPRNIFDLKLAITLKSHGVKGFYTRNTKDFTDLDFFTLYNPLANSTQSHQYRNPNR